MPRNSNTKPYSFAAAIAASGHPRPAAVLNAAHALALQGNLPPRGQGVTAAMRAVRNGASGWLRHGLKVPR